MSYPLRLLPLLLLGICHLAVATVEVTDDEGHVVRLAQPAKRIVSLAPHVTELLYAAGAGPRMAGAVQYSDYPEAATKLPRVGGYSSVDMEAVVALKPDLVVAWKSGNRNALLDKLKALGIPVFINEPRRIEDVAGSIERLGKLAGTEGVAHTAAAAFRSRHAQLYQRYASLPKVTVFYEIWNRPLMTINGKHLISDVMRLCGGENVFGSLPVLAPQVTAEAVLAANPDVILASGMGEARPEWLDEWKRWPKLTATAQGNLYFIPPELIQRHTPRILDGAERMCKDLDEARAKRSKP